MNRKIEAVRPRVRLHRPSIRLITGCRIFSRSPWTAFASCCCPRSQNRASWTPFHHSSLRIIYLDELLPFLLLLCNTALGDGALPASQKRALVFPSLKRNGLDADDMANYRPISNLSFLSNIVETCLDAAYSVS